MKKLILAAVFAALCMPSFAQEMSEAEIKRDKEIYENIQKQVEHLESVLDLEGWQVFYADSILTHNTYAMHAELKALQERKVSNTDLYYEVQFRWLDESYYAFQKILTPEQWKKYLKDGAARNKKARDKERARKQGAGTKSCYFGGYQW